MRKYVGKYQIDETFKLSSRGVVVFAGIIKDGTISIGNFIEFEFDGKKLERKITGIEGIRAVGIETNTGLLIECTNDKEIADLSKWNPNSSVCSVYINDSTSE